MTGSRQQTRSIAASGIYVQSFSNKGRCASGGGFTCFFFTLFCDCKEVIVLSKGLAAPLRQPAEPGAGRKVFFVLTLFSSCLSLLVKHSERHDG